MKSKTPSELELGIRTPLLSSANRSELVATPLKKGTIDEHITSIKENVSPSERTYRIIQNKHTKTAFQIFTVLSTMICLSAVVVLLYPETSAAVILLGQYIATRQRQIDLLEQKNAHWTESDWAKSDHPFNTSNIIFYKWHNGIVGTQNITTPQWWLEIKDILVRINCTQNGDVLSLVCGGKLDMQMSASEYHPPSSQGNAYCQPNLKSAEWYMNGYSSDGFIYCNISTMHHYGNNKTLAREICEPGLKPIIDDYVSDCKEFVDLQHDLSILNVINIIFSTSLPMTLALAIPALYFICCNTLQSQIEFKNNCLHLNKKQHDMVMSSLISLYHALPDNKAPLNIQYRSKINELLEKIGGIKPGSLLNGSSYSYPPLLFSELINTVCIIQSKRDEYRKIVQTILNGAYNGAMVNTSGNIMRNNKGEIILSPSTHPFGLFSQIDVKGHLRKQILEHAGLSLGF